MRTLLALALLLPSLAVAQRTVILVRHAELPTGSAMAEPKRQSLTQAGFERAQRLAEVLKDANVGAVYVTDYVRTQETGEPTALQAKTKVVIVPKGEPQPFIERLRKEHANDVVLVVGHTDTIPGILKAYGAGDYKIESEDYGNIFVVVPSGQSAVLVRLRY
jgi:broad specificity phosphatase PhoE